MTRVVLDLSRLLSRVRHPRPSGVDRVEMAYARGLAQRYEENLDFAAVHPTRTYGRLNRSSALSYLDYLEKRWDDPETPAEKQSLPAVLGWMSKLIPTATGIGSSDVLVQVSPNHLERFEHKKRILDRERSRFVCMVHDLIPIEYPEYARPGGAATHERRMATVARLASAVIVNSASTGRSFESWAEAYGHAVPSVNVALLGTQKLPDSSGVIAEEPQPYFVCLGTIEPRKNHLLLLHQWRHMAQNLPPERVPRLKIIGRRGWENEQIIDLLERSPGVRQSVDEINGCSDIELSALLKNARALLMPSFAEGYGMPIAEALDSNVPTIVSDIPAHREVGQGVPDYLCPLDGMKWQEFILDYADDGPLRRAQMERLRGWNAPTWDTHMDIAQQIIEDTAE